MCAKALSTEQCKTAVPMSGQPGHQRSVVGFGSINTNAKPCLDREGEVPDVSRVGQQGPWKLGLSVEKLRFRLVSVA